jgi:FlaG/FlaF family flagellin (archaellin)
MNSGRRIRAATPVVGNVLLVAVAVVVAVVLITLSFSFLDATGTPTAEAEFEYDRTGAGLEMRPVALGTDVYAELNGQRVATSSRAARDNEG